MHLASPVPSLLSPKGRGMAASPMRTPHPRSRGVEVEAAVSEETAGTGARGKARPEVAVAPSDYLLTRTDLTLTAVTDPLPAQPSEAPISNLSPPVIGGRLSNFWRAWEEIGAEPWVVQTLKEGYRIPFLVNPPLQLGLKCDTTPHVRLLSPHDMNEIKRVSLDQAVEDMIEKGAIEIAPLTLGFYSRIFLVPKPDGRWRPIIDLSNLNRYIHCPKFKMETPATILRAVQIGQWLTSLDMKDAYFHIPIHPEHRRYLRFCHNGRTWQFKALPFGLSTVGSGYTCTSTIGCCTRTQGKSQ